jgi:branched-chain amino acid transport system permease protein
MTRPISSGTACLPRGMSWSKIEAARSRSAPVAATSMRCWNSLSTGPGWIVFTRMPRGAVSLASVRMALQVLLFGRALRHGVLAPVLVTFGLSVMIENLLQVAATSDPRGLNGGALALASFHIGSITVSWLFLAAFLTACAVLSGLQLLLSRTSWGRKVRATSDDLDTARLVGIRVRPVFATVAGIAVATAALAGVFIGTIGTFDPLTGTNILIFAFEAVVIGGIGSLWGTLVGGVIMGITQVVVGEANQAYAVLAVNLLFLAVLTVRPGGLFTSRQALREVQGQEAAG